MAKFNIGQIVGHSNIIGDSNVIHNHILQTNSERMPKNFDVQKGEVFNSKYLKVFVRDLSRIQDVQLFLEGLNCTSKVNISSSTSKNSPPQNLTVYPSRVYNIEEVFVEVSAALESFLEGSPFDPSFVNEGISSLSDVAYSQIIEYISRIGSNLEKYKELRQNFDEEKSRDYFLPFLNSISKNHSATGETFNGIGKTDILVQNGDGDNIFIAECKIWKGQAHFKEAIDQLFERYVNWRDEKLALIIFNKSVQNFSEVISKAKEAMESHPNFHSFVNERISTSFSYLFRHPSDKNRLVKIELIIFDFT